MPLDNWLSLRVMITRVNQNPTALRRFACPSSDAVYKQRVRASKCDLGVAVVFSVGDLRVIQRHLAFALTTPLRYCARHWSGSTGSKPTRHISSSAPMVPKPCELRLFDLFFCFRRRLRLWRRPLCHGLWASSSGFLVFAPSHQPRHIAPQPLSLPESARKSTWPHDQTATRRRRTPATITASATIA